MLHYLVPACGAVVGVWRPRVVSLGNGRVRGVSAWCYHARHGGGCSATSADCFQNAGQRKQALGEGAGDDTGLVDDAPKLQRVCGHCKQPGHNARTCPHKVSTPSVALSEKVLSERLEGTKFISAQLQQVQERAAAAAGGQQIVAASAAPVSATAPKAQPSPEHETTRDLLRNKLLAVHPGLIMGGGDVFFSERGAFALAGRRALLPDVRPAGIPAQGWDILATAALTLREGAVVGVRTGRAAGNFTAAVVVKILCDAADDTAHAVRIVCWPVQAVQRNRGKKLLYKHLAELGELVHIADQDNTARLLRDGRNAFEEALQVPDLSDDGFVEEGHSQMRLRPRMQPSPAPPAAAQNSGRGGRSGTASSKRGRPGSRVRSVRGQAEDAELASDSVTPTKRSRPAPRREADATPAAAGGRVVDAALYRDVCARLHATTVERDRLLSDASRHAEVADDLRQRLRDAEAKVRLYESNARVAAAANEFRALP